MKKIVLTIIYTLFSTLVIASEVEKSQHNTGEQTSKIVSSGDTKNIKPEKNTIEQLGSVTSTISCEVNSPCYLVKDTSDKVIKIINSGSLNKQSTLLITNIVTSQFDFTLMTRYALGNNWKNATPTEQTELVDNFKQLLVFTYSVALSKFKGAKININSESINNKKAIVMSQVLIPNGEEKPSAIKVEYDIAKTSESQPWKAYDIKIENASLVTTYRNQFNEIIQTSKIEGLIKQLKAKVASLQKLRK